MKSLWLAIVLLGASMFAQSGELTMTVSADPGVPWSVTEPVVVRLTFTNHAQEARRAWFILEGFDRTAGLVDRVTVRAESAAQVLEPDANPQCINEPTLNWVMEFCLWTTPILPGESLVIALDVAAFPNAVGYRDATFVLYPLTADNVQHVPGAPVVRVPVRFAYGFLPDVAVSGLGAFGAMLLGLGLLLAASWRMYVATPSQGFNQ